MEECNIKQRKAYSIALGGILAALAVIFMMLGGLIPVFTYVCPILCMVMLQIVRNICGRSIAWAWYGAVSILSCLLSPDKEAAAVFLFLGYYPIIKPFIDAKPLHLILKLLYFNLSFAVIYWLLLSVLGIPELIHDFEGIGFAMTAVLLLMGNITLFTLDKVLEKNFFKRLKLYGK